MRKSRGVWRETGTPLASALRSWHGVETGIRAGKSHGFRTSAAVIFVLLWIGVPEPYAQTETADLRTRADRGEPEAANALANLYANGQGVSLDLAEAIRLYQIAADRGLAVAHFNLGLLHETGRGAPANPAEAFRYYRKAAELGVAAAQFNVGNMYANGKGVTKDDFEALLWFRQAADQGLVEAQYNLALAYEHGRGVRQDEAMAQRWYLAAVAKGNVRAQYNLALMLEEGRGSAPDPESAIALYQVAASQNFAPAQNNLGVMIAAGRGTPQSYIEAYKWLALAVDGGMEPVARDMIASKLTAEQLDAANVSVDRARELFSSNRTVPADHAAESAAPGTGSARLAPANPGGAPSAGGKIDYGAVADSVMKPAAGAGAPPTGGGFAPLSGPAKTFATTDVPLQNLAAGDPRIARLIQENNRANQDALRANLRLVQVSSQLRNLQDRERMNTGPAPAVPPPLSDRKEIAEMANRIEVMRRTISKLAEENRWLYAAKVELMRAKNEHASQHAEPDGRK